MLFLAKNQQLRRCREAVTGLFSSNHLTFDILKNIFTFFLSVGLICQLHAQSTTITPEVMVPPRLSYNAILAIPSPIEGSMAFDTTNKVVRVYKGNKWLALAYSQETFLPGILAWKATGEETRGLFESAKDIAVDPEGNVYITGTFSGSILFGNTTTASTGGYDIFIAKYNSTGTCLWVQKAGGAGADEGRDIAVDTRGNVYVTGQFTGPATFGGLNLTSSNEDIFIAKYNSLGKVQWVQKAGGPKQDAGNGIFVDFAGYVYVAGFFTDTAVFGSKSLISAGSTDMFVAKYTDGGVLEWIRQAGGTDSDRAHTVAVDGAGSIYVAGEFYGKSVFDGTSLYASFGLSDTFIVKYNYEGTLQWLQKAGLPLSGSECDLTTDLAGNVWLTSGSGSIYTAKYSRSGVLLWLQQAKGVGGNDFSSTGVAADAAGNVYVTGKFSGTTTFNTVTLTSAGSSDIFVAKYNVGGDFQWVQQAGGAGSDGGEGIIADAKGNIYAIGNFYGPAAFGATKLTSAGLYDIFIMKIVE